MRDLAALTQQIRTVREAEKRFMSLWRVEQVVVGPEVLDRLADDMNEIAALANEVLGLSADSNDSGAYGSPGGWSINEGGPAGLP